MAAKKVRVVFEYRGDDGNFLVVYRGPLVESKGEHDIRATDAAYASAVQLKEQQRRLLEDGSAPPSP